MNPVEQTELSQMDSIGEKAEQIFEGALQEFLVHGYAGTSMDRVASSAGVSKATVYNHFGDKEGLFIALVKRLAQKKYYILVESQKAELMQAEPKIVLRQLANTILDHSMQDQEYLAFIRLVIGESGRFPELAKTFVHNLGKPGIQVLTEYLTNQRYITIGDPEAMARVIIGTLAHYVLLQEILQGKEIVPMERDRIINTLVDLIIPQPTPDT
ncbi:HTH-type transcriptional repressor AcnR [Planktothrix tepida]|uniref:Transcriptional Regulator, TetR family protein n=2 Tax=Planktothrix TaxID=54304 RepID=A0A1J1LKJ1_9CYAN|nr:MULTISPECIES: TetR/AcrR family transcriptional regulator [Planktothrix]CAD5946938.1 HTH-type transcriptional repressor AcnR [Planktothrix tepida]CAD5964011.1 HTH-type transcriptional repressor AcnR [Planktothrix pseudagardhii]CUR32436.1 Transcriptional Regulator, TetR family protein [Planktothrix tepida PCC 9214]